MSGEEYRIEKLEQELEDTYIGAQREINGLIEQINKSDESAFEYFKQLMEIRKIIQREEIRCAEDLWEKDSLNVRLPEIVTEICAIVGWYEEK